MELKVICDCGQKYKFDVEPVNGLMPVAVACPVCGIDGTPHANASIARMLTPVMPMVASVPATVPSPSVGGLRISHPVAQPPPPPPAQSSVVANAGAMPPPPPAAAMANRTSSVAAPPPFQAAAPAAVPKYTRTNKATASNSFTMGILGALIGAAVGVSAMVGFYLATQFRLPLTGTLVGAAIGYGARLMYKGTSSSLGMMCGAMALVTIPTTIFLLFGPMAMAFGFISVIVGVGMAYRIASA